MKRYFVAIVLIVLSPRFLFGQGAIDGYMNGKGFTDIALTYSYESYSHYFFGSERQQISNSTNSVSLYLDHGFLDSLDLVVSIPFLWTDSLNRNFQDGIFMLRYRNKRFNLDNGALSLMTAFGINLPLSNYPTSTERPIGSKSTIIQARILGQYDFYKGFFLMVKTGYDFRLTPIQQSAVPVLLKFGIASARFYADFWAELYQTFNAESDIRIGGGEGSSWLRIGGTIYYPVNPSFGAFIGGAQFLAGKNIGQASRVNVGLVYKLSRKN